MLSKSTRIYSFGLLVVDVTILLASFTLAYIVRVQYDPRPLLNTVFALDYLQASLIIVPIWILIFGFLGLYQPNVYNHRLLEWSKLFIGSFVGILLVIGWEYVSNQNIFPARLVAVYAFFSSFVFIVLGREMLRFLRQVLYKYNIGIRRVLIIGNSTATIDIAKNISDTPTSGYKIVAIVANRKTSLSKKNVKFYSNINKALASLKHDNITTIIQTVLYDFGNLNQQILGAAQKRHIEYCFIPGEAEFYSGKNIIDVFLGYPMISVYQTPLVGWGAIVKRVFDFFVSLVLIILFSPLFLSILIIKKIFDHGPAFYVSTRLSRFSKPIGLIKFRSMGAEYGTKDASDEFRAMGRNDLAKEYEKNRKVENDPRITKFGSFLRSTSLDELPQLFNVIKGDLSLVGPRPILPQEMKLAKGRSSLLHSVKSGVTGLWQVSGRSELSFDERIDLEIFYAQNWSFWLDIKILLKTIMVVIKKRGAR